MTFKLRPLVRPGAILLLLAAEVPWSDVLKGQTPPQPADVLTQHNDNDRTGWNPRESILTPSSVGNSFGKLFELDVDGLVYAQPLVVTGVPVAGKMRDLVIVATEHNSLYAFDAQTGERVWRRNYGRTIPTPNREWDLPWFRYHDLTPKIGITSTPVIDRATRTVYFTTLSCPEYGAAEECIRTAVYRLHAVNLATAQDQWVEVKGSVPLEHHSDTSRLLGRHANVRRLHFLPHHHLQRPGLLLHNGRVFLGFGAHADKAPFQGWIFAFDAADLNRPPLVWSSLAGGTVTKLSGAGIWQSGMGLTAGREGDVYLTTGNGEADGKVLFGNSVVRLTVAGERGLAVKDFFTPCNTCDLEATDMDLGSSGVLHIPRTDLLLAGGKQGLLYLMNEANLGKHVPGGTMTCKNQVLQELEVGCDVTPLGNPAPTCACSDDNPEAGSPTHHIHGSPVYWRSAARGDVIFLWTENDVMRAWVLDIARRAIDEKRCGEAPSWAVGKHKSPWLLNQGMTGGMLSISSNGNRDGIVWATTPTNNDANQRVSPGILRAYDANDLQRELWNSYQFRDRDDFGNFAKFTPPTVANGRVYVPTFSGRVSVYGLHPPPSPAAPTNLVVNGEFESGSDPWKIRGTGKFVVNSKYPHYESFQGTLCGDVGSTLYQPVVIPDATTYTLSAYCATNIVADNIVSRQGGKVALGITFPNRTGAARTIRRTIAPNLGYQKYEISFQAARGEAVEIWFTTPNTKPVGPAGSATPADNQEPRFAVIDSVVLSSMRRD